MGIQARDILLSTAALRMAALLAVGVGAILAAPTLYAQLIALHDGSIAAEDVVWKLPPPPRSLIEGARSVSTDDATASIPRSASTAQATTVVLNADRRANAQPPAATVPAPAPAAGPALADARPMTEAPNLPPSPVIPSIEELLTPPSSSHARPASVPLPPRRVAATAPMHLAALTPPSASPLVHPPLRPAVAARPPVPRPGPLMARPSAPKVETAAVQPPAYLLHSAEPPPQSQRIPVLSNVMDGINSMGQAISSVVPKL